MFTLRAIVVWVSWCRSSWVFGMSLEQKGGVRDVNDGATAATQATDGVNLADLANVLVQRRAWVFGTTVACLVLARGYLAVVKPTYTSTAEVYVDPRDRPTPKEDPSEKSNVPGDGLLLVESQLRIITSGEVLSRVVDKMELFEDPEFDGRGGLIANVKAMFGFGEPGNPKLAALRRLRLATAAKRNERSFVIDVSVSAHTPQRATDLANAVANAYLEEQASANANFDRRISEAITSQLERMRDSVSRSEQAVAAYKVAHNLVGSRDKLVTDQELTEANTQLTNAKARLNEEQARVKLVDSIESGGAPLESLPEAIQSSTMAQLRARAVDASRAEAQLAHVVGPSHPALQQAQAQVRDVQLAIKNEVKLISQAILPDRRSWPPAIPVMAGALFGGLFFGIVLALLRGALEPFVGTSPEPGARNDGAEKPPPQVVEVPVSGRREQLSSLKAELLAAPANHSILLVRASNDQA